MKMPNSRPLISPTWASSHPPAETPPHPSTGCRAPCKMQNTHTSVFHASATQPVCHSSSISCEKSLEEDKGSNFRTNQGSAEEAANSQEMPGVLSSNSVHTAGCPEVMGVHPALPWLCPQAGLSREWVAREPHTCSQLPPLEAPGIRASVQTGARTPGPCMRQTVAPILRT